MPACLLPSPTLFDLVPLDSGPLLVLVCSCWLARRLACWQAFLPACLPTCSVILLACCRACLHACFLPCLHACLLPCLLLLSWLLHCLLACLLACLVACMTACMHACFPGLRAFLRACLIISLLAYCPTCFLACFLPCLLAWLRHVLSPHCYRLTLLFSSLVVAPCQSNAAHTYASDAVFALTRFTVYPGALANLSQCLYVCIAVKRLLSGKNVCMYVCMSHIAFAISNQIRK
jgi:hypothetical protein